MANYKPKVDPLKAFKNPTRTEEAQSNWDAYWDNVNKKNGSEEEKGSKASQEQA